MDETATEGFFHSSARIDHEEPPKKSSKKFDLGKHVFGQIQNGRHVSKMRIPGSKNHFIFLKV